MSDISSLILIGVGGAGAAIARGVNHAFGMDLRALVLDTDAASGSQEMPFALIGGDRLSGRGTGGDVVSARLAAEDSIASIDEHLEGVRLAVLVAGLGGGAGGGVTIETARHLSERGIPSIVFATEPFAFEGEERLRAARGVKSMLEAAANATFFLPLDQLVAGIDNMDEALARAIDTVANAVTFFWRVIEKPGYLKFDVERLRHLLGHAGRGTFAAVTAQGQDRAARALDELVRSDSLAANAGARSSILLGILGGEDLRLSEIGILADGVRNAFGERLAFHLATVNDEATFCGRISAIVMIFESNPDDGKAAIKKPARESVLSSGPSGRGHFSRVAPTIWHGEDLDTPTYLRKNITLDF